MTNALEVRDVAVSFGGVHALRGVELAVAPGDIVGILGANGAGKTTLFDVISGFVKPDRGTISVTGADVTQLSVRGRALRGLGRGMQDAGLFAALTVAEVVALSCSRTMETPSLAAALTAWRSARRREGAIADATDSAIASFGLADFANKFVSELSTGTRRVVELACLAAQRPSVLLLDEPSSGIAQREVEALGRLILRMHEQLGCALLVIEHDIPMLSSIARELVAMDQGQVVLRDTAKKVLRDKRVVEAYLGTNKAVVQRSGAVA